MSIVNIKVSGNSKPNEQFVVNAQHFKIRIGENQNNPELEAPCPVEYILAGYAGCLNIVGGIVAKELNIKIKSLQIEISGALDVNKYLGAPTEERAGFQAIEVTVKPISDASPEVLKKWITIVESRCPVQDNLFNRTPISLNLVHELQVAEFE
ncbi:MAG: osmotically inducible protein C [Bacteroidetes bacterium HGW-Bacteroidetes-18]|nr:MAG: osmotically inducible protein C [Bacteroidetes bacterium HGW-Bacteroidetes-18]